MPAAEKSQLSGNSLLLCNLVAAAIQANAADWEGTLVPYLWGPEISADAFRRTPWQGWLLDAIRLTAMLVSHRPTSSVRRYQAALAERWSLMVRSAAGAGEPDLAWNAQALVGYHDVKHEQHAVLFGYRHIEVEFQDSRSSANVEADLTMSGPIAGFAFRY